MEADTGFVDQYLTCKLKTRNSKRKQVHRHRRRNWAAISVIERSYSLVHRRLVCWGFYLVNFDIDTNEACHSSSHDSRFMSSELRLNKLRYICTEYPYLTLTLTMTVELPWTWISDLFWKCIDAKCSEWDSFLYLVGLKHFFVESRIDWVHDESEDMKKCSAYILCNSFDIDLNSLRLYLNARGCNMEFCV